MSISNKIKSAFRGDVPVHVLAREVLRRRRAAIRRLSERKNLKGLNETPARLAAPCAAYPPADLKKHFRNRAAPSFWPAENFRSQISNFKFAPEQSRVGNPESVIAIADRIVSESAWELAGFGVLTFDTENVWRRDPLTGTDWGLEYHADVTVYRDGGPDIRVLWELNRLGHVIPLACAYWATGDEKYAETFFSHVEAWMEENPYGLGPNWNCAMEPALRVINLLAAFDIFRRSKACDETRMAAILRLFDHHGRFVEDNNEFSYLATSNHYLSNVIGLFWIGTLLPELKNAARWREFGRQEMLHEIDVQILPDGADFEASTGYHAFVAQMLLYTFILAERNGVAIEERYRDKLLDTFTYLRGIIRPDGKMPLIGDADGSQIVPIIRRDADDQQYLLDLAAVMFDDGAFKRVLEPAPEVFWLFGTEGVENFAALQPDDRSISAAFPNAGGYVMSDGDLYLHFNTNDCGTGGRGSHAHNDALSIEVSAFGRPFIIDPGSYVYNLDRDARHIFRSTAYHSTVMIDGVEQNTIETDLPFIMGDQARPRVLEWQTGNERDRVSAEHFGYRRLPDPIVHRRTIRYEKAEKFWFVEDAFEGKGDHEFSFSFHLAPVLAVEMIDTSTMIAHADGHGLIIDGFAGEPEIVPVHRSLTYGHREGSHIVRWSIRGPAPITVRFLLVTVAKGETLASRLALVRGLAETIGS